MHFSLTIVHSSEGLFGAIPPPRWGNSTDTMLAGQSHCPGPPAILLLPLAIHLSMDFSGLNSARSGPSEEIKIKSDSLCTDMLLCISLFILFCPEKALSHSAEEIGRASIILTRWSILLKSVLYGSLVSRICRLRNWLDSQRVSGTIMIFFFFDIQFIYIFKGYIRLHPLGWGA